MPRRKEVITDDLSPEKKEEIRVREELAQKKRSDKYKMLQALKKNRPPNNPNGRGKGHLNHRGLTLNKRLKLLNKIALNESEKTTDRLNAIRIMTDLLSDKVKETKDGLQETVISFSPAKDNIKNKEEKVILPEKDIEKQEVTNDKQVDKTDGQDKQQDAPTETENGQTETDKGSTSVPLPEPIGDTKAITESNTAFTMSFLINEEDNSNDAD